MGTRFGYWLVWFCLMTTVSFGQARKEVSGSLRTRLDLEGSWQFALDSADAGIREKWFLRQFREKVSLPGTTDQNKKGHYNTDSTTMHLSRVYRYEGPAWYRRKVNIPLNFKDKHIRLVLERTKSTKIWVDDVLIGGSRILQSAQEFDVSRYLSPGEHFITFRVDNSSKLTPYGNVHIYSDDTQTNWNGIIGKMFLEASSKTFISNLQVTPDIQKRKIHVQLALQNLSSTKPVAVDLFVEETLNGKRRLLKVQHHVKTTGKVFNLNYDLGPEQKLWDEYQQPLYSLKAVISSGKQRDEATVQFGMRKFSTKDTQFTINDRPVFLRGKHDACVFPLTGHPPMDVAGWLRVFRIAREYGINHYRFHSWCPPEAAFTAADQIGMYLQVELPFWGGLDADSVASALLAEGKAMLKQYGNHPSFVMLSHGNEIWGGHDRVEKNIIALKAYDSRPLYTMGSNVNIGYHPLQKSSGFFVGARVPANGDSTLAHTRLTQAFADARQGGLLNVQAPATDLDYTFAVAHMPVPIVSHEIGQYQIYPDYKEISKYKGVLEARNLQVFKKRLERAGMLDQASDFQKASGAWAALCYKAEMEAAIRTKGFGGFQLLDLQDFPGQGTALVGILDAFMDSKNVISKKEWLQSCNDVVLLAEFSKYVWTNAERFQAKIELANYSNQNITEGIIWQLRTENGTFVQQGTLASTLSRAGSVQQIGHIDVALSNIHTSQKLLLELALPGGSYSNSYPLWVYPAEASRLDLGEVQVATKLDDTVLRNLVHGGKVLLMPQTAALKDKSVPGLFPPEFWNWGMFKRISESGKKPVSPGTLGLLTDPKHPALRLFPTESHTNWQWFSIIKASNEVILDQTPPNYRPIVQVIDNLERDHKFGMVFEFKVGSGKLLVCSAQLNLIMEKPEAQQLFRSLVDYMNSHDFNPQQEISPEKLLQIL
jgi:hypothetical protein